MPSLSPRNQTGFTLVDLIIAIAVLAVLGALALLAIGHGSDVNNRLKCSENLRQIGQGLMQYSNDNKGIYPRVEADTAAPITAFTGAAAPDPFGVDAPAPNDVTAALFLLIRGNMVKPEAFVCPSTKDKPDPLNGGPATARSNFSSPKNLSYSYTNPYPSKAAIARGYKVNGNVQADFALVADRNDADQSKYLHLTSADGPDRQKPMNSSNHDHEGQLVLYNDGHAEWCTHPWVSSYGDNIYTVAKPIPVESGRLAKTPAGPAESDGIGPEPQRDLDTILLPSHSTQSHPRPAGSQPAGVTKPAQPARPARGQMPEQVRQAQIRQLNAEKARLLDDIRRRRAIEDTKTRARLQAARQRPTSQPAPR